MTPAARLFVVLPVAAVSLAVLPGCLIGSDRQVRTTGSFVQRDALDRVMVGESTPAFVEAMLGAPSSKTTLENGQEVWRWDYTRIENSDGYLFLIFRGETRKEHRASTYVQFKDGVVIEKWQATSKN